MPLSNLSPASRRFILREIRSRPFFVASFVALSIVAGAMEMAGVGLVFPLLLVILQPEALDRFGWLKQFAAACGIEGRHALYLFLMGLVALVAVAKNVFMGGFNFWQLRSLADWKTRLSRRLMRIYLFSDFKIHMEKTTSEIIRNVMLTGQIFDLFFKSLINMIVNICVAAGLIVLLGLVLPSATIFAVSVLLITVVIVYFGMRNVIVRLGEVQNDLYRDRQQVIVQSIGAIKEAKILGKEGVFLDKFARIEHSYFDKGHFSGFLQTTPFLISETVVVMCVLAIIYYEVVLHARQEQALATLGVLGATLFRLAPQFNKVVMNLQFMNMSQNALDIVSAELEEREDDVVEPDVKRERLPSWKTLELRNVTYFYPNSNGHPAVNNLSVTIRRNEFVGITGASGSGKSTLMMILLGLLRPTSGEVLVDGEPLDNVNALRKWQNGIGFVPQGAYLLDASLLENIAYATERDEVDEQRVRELVEMVQLTEVVDEKPAGLHESVGENGGRLSGGQKQRVVIARALYHDPDLLAFDEATSALDTKSEKAVTDNLMHFKGQKTMVAIAHRLTTLRSCDRILLLEHGEVAGFAPFWELEQECAEFRRLVKLSNIKPDDVPEQAQAA